MSLFQIAIAALLAIYLVPTLFRLLANEPADVILGMLTFGAMGSAIAVLT